MKKGRASGWNGPEARLQWFEVLDKLHFLIGVFLHIAHTGYVDYRGLESPKCKRLDEVPRPIGFPGRPIDQSRLTVE